MNSDFTQGSIFKKLVAFMIPVLGTLVLQAAYGAVDLFVVGRFGTTAGLSAVSTGSQVLNLVTFVITQFAVRLSASVGACISVEIGVANNTITTNKNTEITVNKTVEPPIKAPMFFCFFSPIYLAISTVIPIAN